MTALLELIDELRIIRSATHTQAQYSDFTICIEKAKEYLDKERQQLIDAYDNAVQETIAINDEIGEPMVWNNVDGEAYYNELFKTKQP
jgi:adenosyl cobinamide kinase/adenosyl cobinamide phosphate guanylyltransferase